MAYREVTMLEVKEVLDTVPPEVYLLLEDGWVTRESFVTQCGAGDSNFAFVQATLDGQPFVCGDAVLAEGPHTLSVVGTDFAGNSSEIARTSAIDRTPPQITVSGVADGAFVLAPLSVHVTSTDEHPLVTTILLDGVGMDATFCGVGTRDVVELVPLGDLSAGRRFKPHLCVQFDSILRKALTARFTNGRGPS